MIKILKRTKKSDEFENSLDSVRLKKMDQRLRALEERMMLHADELRERICDSLDRIEERLEDEILPSTVNPLDRLGGPPNLSAGGALSEFSNTINLTREHLVALTESISVMRGKISRE